MYLSSLLLIPYLIKIINTQIESANMPDGITSLSETDNIKENQFRWFLLVTFHKVYLKKCKERLLSLNIYLFSFLITLSPIVEEQ